MERWKLVVSLLVPGIPLATYLASRWWEPRRKARRLMRRVRETPIAALTDGEHAHVSGVAAPLTETLVSPIDQRVCLAFRTIIEEKMPPTGHRMDDWSQVWWDSKCVPFRLSDGKADVVVQGPFELGLDVDDRGDVWANLPPTLFRLLEAANRSVGDRELRFKEAFLLPGDRIQVVGRASVQPDPQGTRANPRATPLRRTLSGTEERPVVVADVEEDDSAWMG